MEAGQIIWGSTVLVAAVFVPGLAVTFGLYPRTDRVKWAERIGLSFVFGMFPQLILYFLAKNLNVPMNTTTSLAAIAFVTAAGLAAWKRRS